MQDLALLILNQNLRIDNNLALLNGLRNHSNIAIIYVLDEVNQRAIGGASKWFLHKILQNLQQDLSKYQQKIFFYQGSTIEIIDLIRQKLYLVKENSDYSIDRIATIYIQEQNEPDSKILQDKIKIFCNNHEIEFRQYKGQTIFNSDKILNKNLQYFKVFTHFWKECLNNLEDLKLLEEHSYIDENSKNHIAEIFDLNILNITKISDNLSSLSLIDNNWSRKLENYWQDFSQKKVLDKFDHFLEYKIVNYKEERNIPSLESTSKLSPFLHFGVVSPVEIIKKAINFKKELTLKSSNKIDLSGIDCFISEIGWREFSYYLLSHFPDLVKKPFRSEFTNFPWLQDSAKKSELLTKWQKGKTGYPIIDAAMKELWETGWMHNRTRMIVGSFLVKDLLINWQDGENWFWDCLVDANMASNFASWQWVAGCGADAAPYFRIFNPLLQSQKFDENGRYIKKWLPQLSHLPDNLIHNPENLSLIEQKAFAIKIGDDYPAPIINHNQARMFALQAFEAIKTNKNK